MIRFSNWVLPQLQHSANYDVHIFNVKKKNKKKKMKKKKKSLDESISVEMNNFVVLNPVIANDTVEEKKPLEYKSCLVRDVTVDDGTELLAKTPFIKTWRLKNNGVTPWPAQTKLEFVGGDSLSEDDSVVVCNDEVQSGEEKDVSVSMCTPERVGRYITNFRLVTPDGVKFGHRVWADVSVVKIEVEKDVEKEIEKEVEMKVVVVEQKEENFDGLQQLAAMGFVDTQRNSELLKQFNGDILSVVNALLSI
eukprot:TRINITY_DN3192_c0_g1_i1.p2 TRINITY_DN3192_c0_g1~~TRINITY_DN3192_c0_g1_i1.p2  ORF type:complete len:250 (-),score=76.63 TRINITY_DN3192_c0_g1_i1:78-827(-)